MNKLRVVIMGSGVLMSVLFISGGLNRPVRADDHGGCEWSECEGWTDNHFASCEPGAPGGGCGCYDWDADYGHWAPPDPRNNCTE